MQTYGVADASPCVDDETLFALARGELSAAELSSVERHLQDCADCRAVLAEAARSFQEPAAAADELRGGSSIARYQISALLGAGASGVVYRAFDPQLKRAVAVKLLRSELHLQGSASPELLLREAQSMARLSDPRVVAVYDVGLHEGRVYLVMEYVDGTTLNEWLRAKPRSSAEIIGVFADAGRGLCAAHEKGLVHRDFKPENVLVARDGHAKVTDFGLARASEPWSFAREADDSASTELYAPTRGLVGTPAYMAPELFEGEKASPASDQFAFAVALFTALFDRHPFKAGEGIALGELVTRARAGSPQKPPLITAERERLFNVLLRALSASPSRRFPDLSELLASLERAASVRPRRALLVWGSGAMALGALWLFGPWPRAAARQRLPLALPRVASRLRLLTSSRAGARSAASSAPDDAVAATPPAPGASPSVASTRPPAAERRHPSAPAVRYKDWLKEPF
jgi:serine/threonine protein kinase